MHTVISTHRVTDTVRYTLYSAERLSHGELVMQVINTKMSTLSTAD